MERKSEVIESRFFAYIYRTLHHKQHFIICQVIVVSYNMHSLWVILEFRVPAHVLGAEVNWKIGMFRPKVGKSWGWLW